jgi:hypothetical protein
MRRCIGVSLAALFVFVPSAAAGADDQAANSIVDKAIKAMGGEEKLNKPAAFSWKYKRIDLDKGREIETNHQVTVMGLDHYRWEFSGAQRNGVAVLAGNKGWRKIGNNLTELRGSAIESEKRSLYFQLIPITLVGLKGNGFTYQKIGEEKVGGKPAATLEVVGPDRTVFTLSFDKESGLPVKQAIWGFNRFQRVAAETTFADYKDFNGIKKATKVEIKHDGQKIQTMDITEFKALDQVDPDTFAELK